MGSALERDVKLLVNMMLEERKQKATVRPITKAKFMELTGMNEKEMEYLTRYGPADIVLRAPGAKGQKVMYNYEQYCKMYQPA